MLDFGTVQNMEEVKLTMNQNSLEIRLQLLESVMHVHQRIVNEMTDCLKEFDITRQQYNVLSIINAQKNEEAHINLIKAQLVDKMSDASRIVNRLIAKSLVEKHIDEKDKRKMTVKLLPAGKALLDQLKDCEAKFSTLTENLSDWEVIQANEILAKMAG